jgi:hypothetical protein
VDRSWNLQKITIPRRFTRFCRILSHITLCLEYLKLSAIFWPKRGRIHKITSKKSNMKYPKFSFLNQTFLLGCYGFDSPHLQFSRHILVAIGAQSHRRKQSFVGQRCPKLRTIGTKYIPTRPTMVLPPPQPKFNLTALTPRNGMVGHPQNLLALLRVGRIGAGRGRRTLFVDRFPWTHRRVLVDRVDHWSLRRK